MTSKSPESTDEEDGPPRMLSRSEESEASFWRLKRSSDEWRENRVKRVLAQEEESLFTTLGRMSCLLYTSPSQRDSWAARMPSNA